MKDQKIIFKEILHTPTFKSSPGELEVASKSKQGRFALPIPSSIETIFKIVISYTVLTKKMYATWFFTKMYPLIFEDSFKEQSLNIF